VATFGEWLRPLLVARNMRQGQLARRIGVAESTVSRWLSDRNVPEPEQCAAIAQVLRIPLTDVLRAAGHPVPNGEEQPEISPTVSGLIPLLEMLDAYDLDVVTSLVQGMLGARERLARYEAGKRPDQDISPPTPPARRRRRPRPR
jgi:transcriptional regulator with XRE-family HTH domain